MAAASDTGVLLTTQDADTVGAASDTAVSTANFNGVFTIASQSFGADGAGTAPSLSYVLAITATPVGGVVDSGLDSHGAQIDLFDVGGVIVGSTAAVAPATATDASVVFSLAVDGSGAVTLTQFAQIDHAAEVPSGAPFDDQLAVLATNLVSLTASATITDFDGDTATSSQTVDLGGNIQFADDGPVAANDTDSVDQAGFTQASGNVITAVGTTNAGADTIGADNQGAGITQIVGFGGSDTTFDVNQPRGPRTIRRSDDQGRRFIHLRGKWQRPQCCSRRLHLLADRWRW